MDLIIPNALAVFLVRSLDHDPFFIFVPFHEPHEPIASPPELVKQYRSVAQTEDEAQFFANVANVDKAVGRFMSVLDEMKLREDTLVIFTSDNGPETLNRYRSANRSYGRPGPLRGMKLHTHDAGFRVAGIANWKGHIKAGQVSNVPVSALDLLPTICRLTDTRMPEKRKFHGTDIRKAFNGESFERPIPLHWCYFNAINEAQVAMRDGKWKMLARIRTADGEPLPRMQNITPQQRKILLETKLSDWELYDASSDIGEKNNVAESQPEVAQALSAKMDRLYRELVSESRVWQPVVPTRN
jgi:arylsulfatase A